MKSKGFTLIELLVVIAIIAVLASILFPVFAKAREKARQAMCMSNEKQIGLGIVQYTQDNDEQFPNGVNNTGNLNYSDDNVGGGWANQVFTYIKSKQVYVCPDDSTQAPDALHTVMSYSMNRNLSPWNNGGFPSKSGGTVAELASPAKTVMATEVTKQNGGFANLDVVAYDPAPGYNNSAVATCGASSGTYDCDGGQFLATGVQGNPPKIDNNDNPKGPNGAKVAPRHTEGANYLLADGHVKYLKGIQVSPGPNNNNSSCGQGVADPTNGTSTCTDNWFNTNVYAAGTDNPSFTATYSTK